MSIKENGPVYGVGLIKTLPLGTGCMLQQIPNRRDLEICRTLSERVVAGYEVLLANYQKSMEEVAGLRSAIAAALEELAAAPEINAANYSCDDVVNLNSAALKVHRLLWGAIAEKG